MPVLHFLDVQYKTVLMDRLTEILGFTPIDRQLDINRNMPPRLCVDGYDQAFVGTFDEG